MQAYEGYLDNGRFIPIGKPVNFSEKRRVILTVFDEPVEEKSINTEAWKEFLSAIKCINDEPVPEIEKIKLREIEI